MRRTDCEFAPRGTWNDDTASGPGPGPRRSVSGSEGPYRDARDTLRARRHALAVELASVDEALRTLPPPPPAPPTPGPWTWVPRALAWTAVLALGLTAFDALLVLATRPPIAIERGAPVALAQPLRASDLPRSRLDVARLAPRRFAVARSLVARLLEQTGDAPVAPIVEGGSVTGLRVLGVARGSALEALGLRSGDVVRAVDEHWLDAPDGAALAYDAARTRDHFTLVVTRGRARILLEYEVIG